MEVNLREDLSILENKTKPGGLQKARSQIIDGFLAKIFANLNFANFNIKEDHSTHEQLEEVQRRGLKNQSSSSPLEATNPIQHQTATPESHKYHEQLFDEEYERRRI